MKRWKQYSLFLLLLISGLLLTGAGFAGEHTIYADYSRPNGWMTPALSLVFQGVKDGVAPWELFGKPVQTSAEPDLEKEDSGESQASEESGEGGAGENIPSGDISGNSIGSIDLGKATGLVSLDCSENRLSRVDVSACPALAIIDCSGNTLTGLDVAVCGELTALDCSRNSLTSLDVSGNTKLETLDCSENPALAKLWLNGTQDGSLVLTKDDTTEIFHNDGGVVIPDAALKAWLVGNYDDDGDGELSIAEADNVTLVNCSGRGVKDLTGLEACTNLETIDCSNNDISTVILPRLTKLTTLRCYGNPVEKLDLTGCSALQALYLQDVSTNAVSGTSITISGYSQAASLTFSVADTPFTSLTVSGSGMLASLDVTANSQLTSLDCSGNTALQNIDVSSLTALQSLNLSGCDLQSLDVTHNTALTALLCNDNSIPSQFDGYLPVRPVSVRNLLRCRESAVDDTQFLHPGLVQTLQSPYPQVQIRIHRVFHQHRYVGIFQRIRDFLDKERVRGSPGAYPHHVHSELHAVEDVFLACHLRAYLHPEFVFHPLHPFESRGSDSLECVRMCARLPDAGAEHADSQRLKPTGCLHDLYFRLCAARAGYQKRPLVIEQIEKVPFLQRNDVEFLFHNYRF